MRFIGILLFTLLFAATPVILLDTMVMPELEALQHTYSHLDELTAKSAQ